MDMTSIDFITFIGKCRDCTLEETAINKHNEEAKIKQLNKDRIKKMNDYLNSSNEK